MFPLIDFQTYAAETDYGFASPLVIEFGFGAAWFGGFTSLQHSISALSSPD